MYRVLVASRYGYLVRPDAAFDKAKALVTHLYRHRFESDISNDFARRTMLSNYPKVPEELAYTSKKAKLEQRTTDRSEQTIHSALGSYSNVSPATFCHFYHRDIGHEANDRRFLGKRLDKMTTSYAADGARKAPNWGSGFPSDVPAVIVGQMVSFDLESLTIKTRRCNTISTTDT
jgi:hypothetical protein